MFLLDDDGETWKGLQIPVYLSLATKATKVLITARNEIPTFSDCDHG